MSFLFATSGKGADAVQYGIEDQDWNKPVVVYGRMDDVERLLKHVTLRNSLELEESQKIMCERIVLRDLTNDALTRFKEAAQAGSRLMVVITDVDGATRRQIHELFDVCGVRIIFGVRRYELLWLPDVMSQKSRGFSLVTLGPGECVIDYGTSSLCEIVSVRAYLFAPLPSVSRVSRSVISAEKLREMLSVFDHEIS